MLRKKYVLFLALLSLPMLMGAATQMNQTKGRGTVQSGGPVPFPPITTNSALVPGDIPGGAANADLTSAATFAWQEFIALNWPAQVAAGSPRDTPDLTQPFGAGAVNGTVVWHTFRGKAEIYPGSDAPHGFSPTAPDYGYDDPPRYIYGMTAQDPYDPGVGGPYQDDRNELLAAGDVPACTGQAAVAQPAWINLDEATQIGLDRMYAGEAPATGIPGQQILFLAKANRQEYDYVVPKSWYNGTAILPIIKATLQYQQKQNQAPLPGSSRYVSLPTGTIEVKSAWRLLGPKDMASHFATTTARFYQPQNPTQMYDGKQGNALYPCWTEGTFGLVALHIIHKTPSAPYFIYATFSQADNLRDVSRKPVENAMSDKPVESVENADGGYNNAEGNSVPLDANISSTPAKSANPANPGSIQQLSPTTSSCVPGPRLYYQNVTQTPTPQGTVCVNHRENKIPADIINVNKNAHQAIQNYLAGLNPLVADSPWLHYKLVNVQFQPINNPTPGAKYTGTNAATYYQSNEVVETDYNLQFFSGHFQQALNKPNQNTPTANLITDFHNNGNPYSNVLFNDPALGTSRYLMGGCMGCHGNSQVAGGTDFSFILQGQRVNQPDLATGTPQSMTPAQKDAQQKQDQRALAKYRRLLKY